MNDTIIAARAKEQHDNFLGKVFTHFSKPKARFVREATYGIQASGDTKLSSIVRAIEDDVAPIQTEKRLSRNIEDETLEQEISDAILSEGARHVGKDTLILVDPTEIRKEYAYKMEYVTRVRDASRSSKEGRDVVVNGYHGCIAAACTSGSRKTIPLALKLWSSRAPGFKGENDEVLKIINDIFEATGGKGIVVYDRGGDRPAFYGDFIEKGRDFVVRVKSRSVLSWNGLHEIGFLTESCTMQHHHHVTFDSHGKECNIQTSFGTMPARLPMFPDKQLHLVVVKGFGQQPMMLLTSLPVDASFKSQWRIVEAYLSRWRIEETIRFVKQEYGCLLRHGVDRAAPEAAGPRGAARLPEQAAERSAAVRRIRNHVRPETRILRLRKARTEHRPNRPTHRESRPVPVPAGLCGTARPRRRIAASPSDSQNTLPKIIPPL